MWKQLEDKDLSGSMENYVMDLNSISNLISGIPIPSEWWREQVALRKAVQIVEAYEEAERVTVSSGETVVTIKEIVFRD